MAKLSDRQHKQLIARYAETNNYRQVAREFGVSEATVRSHCKGDKKTTQICAQKKEQNTQDMLEFLESNKNKAQEFIMMALEGMADAEKIRRSGVQSLATAIGIVVDKYIQNAPQAESAQLQKAKEILGDIDGVIE